MVFDDNRLLFIDYRHVESAENVSLTLNPPVKKGPCLVIDREWEMGGCHAYCVVEWQGRYRMYCKTTLEDGRVLGAVAVSEDGITWEKPELGRVEFKGSRANNLFELDGHRPGEVAVFVDPTGPDEHRFKMICHNQAEGGMYMMTSPDGLGFKRAPGHLLNFICDNNNSSFYDPRIGKYVVYLRGWNRSGGPPPVHARRTVVRAETDDLFKPLPYDKNAPDPWHVSPKWTDIVDGGLRRINKELPSVLQCDDLDPIEGSLYQGAVVQYLPEAYLAFPSFYYSYPYPPEGKFVNDGVLDIQFASSRDGIEWRRDFRGSYVRLDLPDGPCTKLMHLLTGMVPHGYRISQYYYGGRRTHGEGRLTKDTKVERKPPQIGDPIAHRLEQRLDGFVSADSAYTGGVLVTTPFRIEHPVVRLNIDTSAGGVAHAALLEEDGSAIPGFTLEDSDRIQGNDTQYELSWKGSSSVSSLVGKYVKLVLRSRSTKLFAVYP